MFAYLLVAATASTFTVMTASSLRVLHDRVQCSSTLVAPGRVQRSSTLVAQWISGIDEASGQTYYYNEQTGASQWEPPYGQPQDQYGYTQQALDPAVEEVVAYISGQLQEPQLRIVRAVVELLGAEVAYWLLDQTAQVQAQGGMVVPDTGRPRTSGGIYLKLLKEATHLPQRDQDAALLRIKEEGKRVKSWEKAQA